MIQFQFLFRDGVNDTHLHTLTGGIFLIDLL
jgi:hypothetical protein